ncbi:ATP-binding protein [Planococcus maritimus]|uniref:ATP-binding protein n=1 Tax=Planococcus maritimus TaxID=192421 RepID=UPI0036F33967
MFLTAVDLVAEYYKAEAKGTASRLIKKWIRSDLLVLDEVGYFPYEEFSAKVFLQVISWRYEHGTMILTSYKNLSNRKRCIGKRHFQLPFTAFFTYQKQS